MKDFKKLEGSIIEYDSIEALAKDWHIKPRVKQTKDKDKLKKQRENFCARNRCRVCKKPMIYWGSGVMACANEECKGISKDETIYAAAYKILDSRSAEIAENLFREN